MTYRVSFNFTVPDNLSEREARLTVNDALQAMVERENRNYTQQEYAVDSLRVEAEGA